MPLSDFLYTDDVDDVMAAHVNRLTASLLRGELGAAQNITTQTALADGDYPYLTLTPNADLNVLLPPEAATNHIHIIENGSGTNTLTIKDDSGTTTIATLRPNRWAMFIPALGTGWKVLGRPDNASYLLYAACGSSSPADATTYYFGNQFSNVLQGTSQRRKIIVPRKGTIYRVDLIIISTTGTSETSTISVRLNDTTDTIVSSAVNLSVNPFEVSVNNLNIPVVAGDFIEMKWVTPTWATNPTTVSATAQIFVE